MLKEVMTWPPRYNNGDGPTAFATSNDLASKLDYLRDLDVNIDLAFLFPHIGPQVNSAL